MSAIVASPSFHVSPSLRLGIGRFLLLAAVLAVWQFAPAYTLIDSLISRPTLVAERIFQWIANGLLIRESIATLSSVIFGLFFGGVAGSFLGLVAGFWRPVGAIVEPWLTGLFALPKSAFIPLFILWFGISGRQHVLFVATVVFFFFFFAMFNGARNVPASWRNLLALSGANAFQSIRILYIPASFGWLLAAMRLAIPHAFVAAISIEVIASRDGLGHLVKTSSAVLDATGTVAAVAWLVALSTTLGATSIKLAESARWNK